MSEVISPIVFQLGVGGVGGFVVGFALKKLSKLVLILTGLFVLHNRHKLRLTVEWVGWSAGLG
jgi:uncharacterized membrane protein (Fun14 family)